MVKNLLQCRRPGFNPWVGKIPWRREWLPTPVYPLQYSCLENPVDRGACQGTVHGVAKSWMQLSDTHTSSEKQGFCAVWSAVLQKTLQGFLRDQPLWTSLPHLSLFFLLRLASSWMHDFFLLLKTHLSLILPHIEARKVQEGWEKQQIPGCFHSFCHLCNETEPNVAQEVWHPVSHIALLAFQAGWRPQS